MNCAPHCPQLKFRDAYGDEDPNLLSLGDFRRAIATVPKTVFITFAGFSEPFMNPLALDMLEHARAEGYRIKLFSTLVGLPPEKVDRLVALAPDVFVPHFPDNRGIAKVPDTPRWRETFVRVMREIPAVHGYSRMDDSFVSNQRAGNCDGAPPLRVSGPLYCPKLRDPEPVLLPNGDVVLCCMDWTLTTPIGNLLRQSWDDVTTSEAYRGVQRGARGLSGAPLCRGCTFAVPTLSARRAVVAAKHAAERVGLVPMPVATT